MGTRRERAAGACSSVRIGLNTYPAAELKGARWARSDAAREATMGAKMAADAAELVAGQARDAGSRAAEARQREVRVVLEPHQREAVVEAQRRRGALACGG